MPRYHVILNQNAGTATAVEAALSEAFAGELGEYKIHHVSGDPTPAARTAAKDPACQVLVAAGGDGTVAAVAAVAVRAGKTLGVMPAGTLNHFAKDFGLPADQPACAKLLRHGAPKQIDYLDINGLLVLNNASLGVYPKLVRQRDKHASRIGKWPAMAVAAVKLLISPPRRATYTISVEGQVRIVKSQFIFVGNNNYHTSAGGLGGRKHLAGGTATFVVYLRKTWRELMQGLLETFTGRTPSKGIWIEHASTIKIDADRKLMMSHDGEIASMNPPLICTMMPEGLTVIGHSEAPTDSTG